MTPLAPHADQAVRHAVDAYIDGRFLPTFEGDAAFETRNSRYRLLDGVLFEAPDPSLVGAELVGWLVEFPSRSEVTPTWRNGARAVLVDTRNDGVRGPHIVVTSATRAFRSERPGSNPRMPTPAPVANAGSRPPQGGSTHDQAWDRYPAPVAPPAPVSPSWGYYPAAVAPLPAGVGPLPPPTRMPTPPPVAAAHPATLPPPPVAAAHPATLPPPPPPRPLPRALPPPPAMVPQLVHESMPFSASHDVRQSLSHDVGQSFRHDVRQSLPRTHVSAARPSHQRGLPLR